MFRVPEQNAVDDALAEIERLPGRHLCFLDDHPLGHPRFARALFSRMRRMGRVFQGASTVNAILGSDLIERAAEAGMRSVFVGFETLDPRNLALHAKTQNLSRSYEAAIGRCHDLGVMVNGSFVFGLDADGPDVFTRTVDRAVGCSLETATFHIMTPYPGTGLHTRLTDEGRSTSTDWDRYDTRHVYRPAGMPAEELEPLWDLVIRARRVDTMLPMLERTLDAFGAARQGTSRSRRSTSAAPAARTAADATTSTRTPHPRIPP